MRQVQFTHLRNTVIDVIDGFEKKGVTKLRVGTKVWKYILLNNKETIMIQSTPYTMVAKNLGCGVYEITLQQGLRL